MNTLLTPPPTRSAAQWADEERREPVHSSRAGRWETALTPYWIPVLAASCDYRTRRITAVTGSQSGKTSTLLSILGKRLGDGPRMPALFVLPTMKLARSFATDRIRRLIDDSPQLRAITAGGKRRSTFEYWIAGCPLRLAWAGSATELKSHAVGLLVVDELDGFLADVGGEGDPLTLARARTITYRSVSLTVVTSSPTIEDESPIVGEWETGSMEVAEWACPQCRTYHRPLSMYLRWPKDASPREAEQLARYCCPHCGVELDDTHKPRMLAEFRFKPYERRPDGEYIPSSRELDHHHRSFWISGFFSPWLTFGDLARELCGAYRSGDVGKVQSTINTQFGELWRTRGERPELEDVLTHRQDYERGYSRPHGVQFVTLGVDVQQDRLYWVARGWGCEQAPMESWLLDYGEIHGSTDYDEVYQALERLIRDVHLGVLTAWIDSGYKPGITFSRPDHAIYSFCRRSGGRAFPTKGYQTRPVPVQGKLQDVTIGGRTIRDGVRLYLLDTTFFKSWLYSRIRSDLEELPDCWHLPRDITEDYGRQVVAEEVVQKASGQLHFHCPRSRQNHYLDAEVCATAAAYAHLQQHRIEPLGAPQEPQRALPEPAGAQLGRRGSQGFQRRGLV